MTSILEARNLRKSYGPIEVLHGVDFDLRPGEVHAIVGENGAGKSTMMKCLSGYLAPSGGEILLDGTTVSFRDGADAEDQGVVLIHQEFNLAEDLTVEENIFLGREIHRGPFTDGNAMRKRTRELLELLQTDIDPDLSIRQLAVSDMQMVEIAKAVSRDARVLFMDEPTDVLTGSETEVLFQLIRRLRDDGVGIVYVSHKLGEVMEIADRVTILRDGNHIATEAKTDLDAGRIARLMVGRELGLAEDRNYGSWEEMLETEAGRPDGERIDAVSIVTPNHVHHPVAMAAVEAGFHVICDKPMVIDSDQANDLITAVEKAGVVFGVTYNYTGYPMVKQARQMVAEGKLGKLRKVIVEYNQGWLATKLEDEGVKQADWRTDPSRSGAGGAIGDIGSHAENLVVTITGLELESICADLTAFVPGRQLDDDANVLLRFEGGAKGILTVSQIEIGAENDLRIRVHGTEGSMSWRQENPNYLTFETLGGPTQVLSRGNDYLGDAATRHTRIPTGHPEAFIEAFANVYGNVAAAIRGHGDADYPTVYEGARGVHFIERTVASAESDAKWTDARWRRP